MRPPVQELGPLPGALPQGCDERWVGSLAGRGVPVDCGWGVWVPFQHLRMADQALRMQGLQFDHQVGSLSLNTSMPA